MTVEKSLEARPAGSEIFPIPQRLDDEGKVFDPMPLFVAGNSHLTVVHEKSTITAASCRSNGVLQGATDLRCAFSVVAKRLLCSSIFIRLGSELAVSFRLFLRRMGRACGLACLARI
ncbi:hypothetical protein PB2503_13549 [Parvularcula bermudensis HTCC2503]|uniref:Uncharacterized protein n=1 Tax=Parvularcula bermudensis (strain ATCC BAA-594 / HTCC2503 / KCTC 12087) TaxID=314260 RepID=E0THF5_PARBH|nr:hypothetical protein PB2503_13549 [Parvularcula bermudensis HTCC2503]